MFSHACFHELVVICRWLDAFHFHPFSISCIFQGLAVLVFAFPLSFSLGIFFVLFAFSTRLLLFLFKSFHFFLANCSPFYDQRNVLPLFFFLLFFFSPFKLHFPPHFLVRSFFFSSSTSSSLQKYFSSKLSTSQAHLIAQSLRRIAGNEHSFRRIERKSYILQVVLATSTIVFKD